MFHSTSRPRPLLRPLAGILLALAIAVLMLAIFGAILLVPGGMGSQTMPQPGQNIAHLVRMGLLQAFLSTTLSLGAGVGLAWALNRLHFKARGLVTSLFATAIVAPGLVVGLGIINVWGRAGWVNDLLAPFSLSLPGTIFGLGGILLAHTILNGTFAAHVLLARLDAIPAQRLKTGQNLALAPLRRFMVLDWPAMSPALPGLAAIIFLLAFTSFPIVLLLGGGPANQTLEVAIYSAVRQSFDLKLAATLALVQLAICALIILPALAFSPPAIAAGSTSPRPWSDRGLARPLQVAILVLGIAGFGAPLVSILVQGLNPSLAETLARPSFWRATATSLGLGLASALLCLLFAIRLSMARTELQGTIPRTLLQLPLYAYLVMPALVLSLGAFLILLDLGIPHAKAAPFVLVGANVLLALPFAYAIISPAFLAIHKRHARLCRSLNLTGLTRWRHVEWPLMGREIGLAAALAFCFSLGDLGVIALFGTSEFSTLPWQMFRALGAYRTGEAATIAAFILVLTLGVFLLLPPLMQRLAKNAEAA